MTIREIHILLFSTNALLVYVFFQSIANGGIKISYVLPFLLINTMGQSTNIRGNLVISANVAPGLLSSGSGNSGSILSSREDNGIVYANNQKDF